MIRRSFMAWMSWSRPQPPCGQGSALFPGPDAGRDGLLANLTPGRQETRVDSGNDARAPLLFIADGADHLMPPSMNRSNAKHYAKSKAVTDYKEFPGRLHYTCGEQGGRKSPTTPLKWATTNATRPVA
jgi:hypothetical protein